MHLGAISLKKYIRNRKSLYGPFFAATAVLETVQKYSQAANSCHCRSIWRHFRGSAASLAGMGKLQTPPISFLHIHIHAHTLSHWHFTYQITFSLTTCIIFQLICILHYSRHLFPFTLFPTHKAFLIELHSLWTVLIELHNSTAEFLYTVPSRISSAGFVPLELQVLQVEQYLNSSAVFCSSWISVCFSYFVILVWVEICIWLKQKFV